MTFVASVHPDDALAVLDHEATRVDGSAIRVVQLPFVERGWFYVVHSETGEKIGPLRVPPARAGDDRSPTGADLPAASGPTPAAVTAPSSDAIVLEAHPDDASDVLGAMYPMWLDGTALQVIKDSNVERGTFYVVHVDTGYRIGPLRVPTHLGRDRSPTPIASTPGLVSASASASDATSSSDDLDAVVIRVIGRDSARRLAREEGGRDVVRFVGGSLDGTIRRSNGFANRFLVPTTYDGMRAVETYVQTRRCAERLNEETLDEESVEIFMELDQLQVTEIPR